MTDVSAQKIVDLLRSESDKDRAEGLRLLFGERPGACMIRLQELQTQITVTTPVDAQRLFLSVLYLAQTVGRELGLHLSWTQDPSRLQVVR